MTQTKQRGGAGNFAEDPERARKPVARAAKSVGAISGTILREPGKLEEKEVKKAVAPLSRSK